jgi:2-hydroxychromene-2-carboxylate isomerase
MAALELTHFSDPGCPFAYSAAPMITALQWRYGDQLAWRHVMIGLTERREQYEQRGYTPLRMSAGQRAFRRHGMPFGRQPKPRMAATSRACRAVVAVRLRSPELEWPAFRSLQLTQFTTPLPLDDDAALLDALGRLPGVDAREVVGAIDDPAVVEAYERDRAEARTAAGGPTEFQGKAADTDGAVRYTAPSIVFARGDARLEAGGFQPIEAYDVCVANLDTGLERRGAPEDVAEVLDAFPFGITTREVAMCLLPPTGPPDDEAAELALLGLAAEGRAAGLPIGDGTLWFAPGSPFRLDALDRGGRFERDDALVRGAEA